MFDPLDTSIRELEGLLASGKLTSVELVNLYLDRIEQDNINGLGLRAIMQVAPVDKLQAIARQLDQERSEGRRRGPLHGIPLIIKDCIGTHPEMGMETTSGSRALQGSVLPDDAFVVKHLREAGAIILAKANMSELGNFRSPKLPWAYSEIGGQCTSAYVEGGFVRGEGTDGRGNPSGSSSGSAVGLSAGFAAGALGTDARGSLAYPAHRAALFGITPTRGLVSRTGVVPFSISHDTIGTMGMTTYDAALLLEVIAGQDPTDTFTMAAPKNASYTQHAYPPASRLEGWRIGIPRAQIVDVPEEVQRQISWAGEQLSSLGAVIIDHADMRLTDNDRRRFAETLTDRFLMEFPYSMDRYLETLLECKIKSTQELVAFNEAAARDEGRPCYQDRIEAALSAPAFDSAEHRRTTEDLKEFAEDKGLVELFDRHQLDAIITAVEKAQMTDLATCTGFAAGTVPLGYKADGEPFGLLILVRPWHEAKLISLMAVCEANFPHRRSATRLISRA